MRMNWVGSADKWIGSRRGVRYDERMDGWMAGILVCH